METFKTFLIKSGVQDVDELILFLNSLPDNPEDLVHVPGIAVDNTLAEMECKLKHQTKKSGRASCKANQVGFVIPKK